MVPNRRSFLLALGASCVCAKAGASPRSFTIRVIDPAGYALDSARWHLGLSEQTPLQSGKVDKEGVAKLSFEWQPGLTLYLEADGFLSREFDLKEERLGLWTLRLSFASCSSPHANCDSFVPLKRKARRQTRH